MIFKFSCLSSLPYSHQFVGQYQCFRMSKTVPANQSLFILHCWTSYQFLSIPVGLHRTIVYSYQFVKDSHWHVLLGWCYSIHCNMICNDMNQHKLIRHSESHRLVLIHIGSCYFLLVLLSTPSLTGCPHTQNDLCILTYVRYILFRCHTQCNACVIIQL